MPDVVYGFSVDDNLVDRGLRDQEQKFKASAGRIDRSFAQAGESFQKQMFGAQQMARAASAGFAASAAILVKWTNEYAEENKSAAAALAALKQQTSGFKSDLMGQIVGDGSALKVVTDLIAKVRELYGWLNRNEWTWSIASPLAGGIRALGDADYYDALAGQASADAAGRRLSGDTERMIAVRAAARQAGAGSRESRWWLMRQRGQEFEADVEAAVARRDDAVAALRDEVRAGKRDGTPMDESVRLAREASIADVYNTDVMKARVAREAREAAAERTAAEQRDRATAETERMAREASGRADDERRAALANKSGRVEIDAMRVGELRLRGRDREADALEAEVELKEKLLEIEQNQLLTAEVRLALQAQAATVYDARLASMAGAAGVVTGGRGVDAGVASAAGVVRGSLVATARENPAALQKRTNELLERIARAVEDGDVSTFAP